MLVERQPKIHDLRELLLQQGHKHIVQGLTQNAGLVGWPSREGGQIDRVFAMGNGGDVKTGDAHKQFNYGNDDLFLRRVAARKSGYVPW